MKIKRLCILLSAALLLSALLAPTAAFAGKKKKKASGPVVVGTDEVGDWGANVDPNIGPLGAGLGQDIVEASIEQVDKDTLNFVITVTGLPPTGGVPESSRYNWDFTANGDAFQLTGAFTEYIRGVCNPLHTGACPPPQDPGQAPFFLRHGPCTVGSDCFVEAVIQAEFDASKGTITIPVPLSAIKSKKGSVIGPGVSTMGGGIYAAPAAMVSHASLPNDTMVVMDSYKVPGK